MTRGFVVSAVGIAALLLSACSQDSSPRRSDAPARSDTARAPARPSGISGKVTETMDSGGYTYVQVESDGETFWAAAPQFEVEVGQEVVVPDEMPMYNYHSSTLDRTFEMIYFAASITGGSGGMAGHGLPAGHPPIAGHGGAPASEPVDVSGIERPEDGKTVEELFAEKSELAGQQVLLRGKVVRFNSQIMGKNWVRVQDGTGDADAGTQNLTVTTDAVASVGDTVLVQGTVVVDKDFGFGYQYDLMIEDAELTVE